MREEREESEDEKQHSDYNKEEDEKSNVDPEDSQWIWLSEETARAKSLQTKSNVSHCMYKSQRKVGTSEVEYDERLGEFPYVLEPRQEDQL